MRPTRKEGIRMLRTLSVTSGALNTVPTVGRGALLKRFGSRFYCGHSPLPGTVQGTGIHWETHKILALIELKF